MVQFHQERESPYAYKLAEEEFHAIENHSFVSLTLVKQIDTLSMNKRSYTCNEDNQNSFMHCVENYYSKKLGCSLPWSMKEGQNNHTGNACTGKDKFREFKSIFMNIQRTEEAKNLTREGCFIPNCLQQSWDMRKEKLYEVGSGFEFYMPQKPRVLLRREVKLYTPINFFAEVGGYLGLLLGESLISYILVISNWIHVIVKKLKEKCRKDAEETNGTPE